jgi:hypothetical protein
VELLTSVNVLHDERRVDFLLSIHCRSCIAANRPL